MYRVRVDVTGASSLSARVTAQSPCASVSCGEQRSHFSAPHENTQRTRQAPRVHHARDTAAARDSTLVAARVGAGSAPAAGDPRPPNFLHRPTPAQTKHAAPPALRPMSVRVCPQQEQSWRGTCREEASPRRM